MYWLYIHIRLFRDFWRVYFNPNHLTLWNGVTFHFKDRRQVVPIIAEVWLDNVYTNLDGLRDDAVIFDVGGHIGTFSVFAAHRHPHARIFTFEPDPINFACLQMNTAPYKNIQVFNLAVSDKEGAVKLYVQSDNSGTHSLYGSSEHPVDAQSTTLEAAMRSTGVDHIDFLKLDCEGAEEVILKDLPNGIGTIAAEDAEPIPGHSFIQVRPVR